jgi:hypothetical protein
MTQQPSNPVPTDLARDLTSTARCGTQLPLDRTTMAWIRTT